MSAVLYDMIYATTVHDPCMACHSIESCTSTGIVNVILYYYSLTLLIYYIPAIPYTDYYILAIPYTTRHNLSWPHTRPYNEITRHPVGGIGKEAHDECIYSYVFIYSESFISTSGVI